MLKTHVKQVRTSYQVGFEAYKLAKYGKLPSSSERHKVTSFGQFYRQTFGMKGDLVFEWQDHRMLGQKSEVINSSKESS